MLYSIDVDRLANVATLFETRGYGYDRNVYITKTASATDCLELLRIGMDQAVRYEGQHGRQGVTVTDITQYGVKHLPQFHQSFRDDYLPWLFGDKPCNLNLEFDKRMYVDPITQELYDAWANLRNTTTRHSLLSSMRKQGHP